MKTDRVTEPDFGAHALPATLERLRRSGARLGTGPVARRATSLIRRIVCLGRDDPFDVEPFPGQRARLYPRDNLSEKRVFAAPQFWDAAERETLAELIAETPGPFRFVDAGANVGLYTLAARAEAIRGIRAVAIEPDPGNLARLRFNLQASGAGEVAVAPVALAARPGEAVLSMAGGNRGEIAASAEGEGLRVPARPLLDVIRDAGLERIDALKIDIEGMEGPVLAAFFREAPAELWPRMILIEARRGEETEALALLRTHHYVEAKRTKLNVILTAPPGAGLTAELEATHGQA